MPYRPTERTEARRAATRERIVAAAIDQMGEGGYASASVQAVARRAGGAGGPPGGAGPSARRALAGPVRAYALIAEPVDPRVEAERLIFRRGYRDVLSGVLRDGVESGELAAHDSETVAAALVGAIGESLVGPLARSPRGADRREA